MKIFLNHISRCGGTSLMKYFQQAYDGDLIIINSKLVRSEEALYRAFEKFQISNHALIIGHTHQPSLPNRTIVNSFWLKVYEISDLHLSILRNPIDRAVSWINEAGQLHSGNSVNGIPFLYRGLSHADAKVVSVIDNQRGPRFCMDDNVFNSISVENFHCDSPDNYNIAASIANYPIELLSHEPYQRWITPLPLRSIKHQNDYAELLNNGITFSRLCNYLSIPEYRFFALENIGSFVKFMESNNLMRSGYEFPHINSNNVALAIGNKTKLALTNNFPESYLLWKHALGIF